MLAGLWSNQLPIADYQLPVAMLMGGSVTGMAYKLEGRVKAGSELGWKLFFIPTGFIIAYSLIYSYWLALAMSSAVIYFLLNIFIEDFRIKGMGKKSIDRVVYLEEKMKNCC